MSSLWWPLGIRPTRDRVKIRRAYARRAARLGRGKQPEARTQLDRAYERAMRFCDAMESQPVPSIARSTRSDEARPPERAPLLRRFARGPVVTPPDTRVRRRWIVDIDAAFDRAWQRIRAALLSEGDTGAATALAAVLRKPVFRNAATRHAFGIHLLRELARLDPVPEAFVTFAARTFAWPTQLRRMPPDLRATARSLLADGAGMRRLHALRRQGRWWVLRAPFDRSALAAAVLTGSYRPAFFRLVAFDPYTRRAVGHLLRDLRAHHRTLIEVELNALVIAWWDGALGLDAGRPVPEPRAA